MRTKEEQIKELENQIKDLQKVEKFYFEAYSLQNSADVILHNHYKIDDEGNYLDNDFWKITFINKSSPLFKAEIQTRELIKKLTIELETLKK